MNPAMFACEAIPGLDPREFLLHDFPPAISGSRIDQPSHDACGPWNLISADAAPRLRRPRIRINQPIDMAGVPLCLVLKASPYDWPEPRRVRRDPCL